MRLLSDAHTRKIGYVHAVEYDSALQRKEILRHATKGGYCALQG